MLTISIMNDLVYHFLTPMDLPHKTAAHPPSKVVSSKYSPLMVAWSFPLILFYDTVQQSPKYTNTHYLSTKCSFGAELSVISDNTQNLVESPGFFNS